MNKITFKIAFPIILTGLFAIIVFTALNYERLDAGFYIVFLFLSIYTFLFGFATGQNFAMPIKKLLRRATELSQGDLKTRVYLETKDEFGELSKVFNKIAQDLEESKVAGEKAQETIDIKVKAKTQALQEVISALEQKVNNRSIELQRTANDLDRAKKDNDEKNYKINSLSQEIENLKSELQRVQETKKLEKNARTS